MTFLKKQQIACKTPKRIKFCEENHFLWANATFAALHLGTEDVIFVRKLAALPAW